MKIWIDLANSPHALLFAPISRALEQEGNTVVVTARDHAQTVQLGREHWPDLAVIGEESPKVTRAKAGPMLRRIARLRRWAGAERPDLALSHNSYAQIVAAKTLRVPTVTAMDYEHQPLNHLAFRLSDRILLPAALRSKAVRRQGAAPRKTRYYDGFKEEAYLWDFEPDHDVLSRVGLPAPDRVATIVARTSPSRATYHQFDNDTFLDSLRAVGSRPNVQCVVLLRHPEQRRQIDALGLPRCKVLTDAVDSRSLMIEADAFLGGGGTMTREAALLGVPTYTVFAGSPAAVDRRLEAEGRLKRVTAAADLPSVSRRAGDPASRASELRARGKYLLDVFTDNCRDIARGAKGQLGTSASVAD
jgi:hypothetical protein